MQEHQMFSVEVVPTIGDVNVQTTKNKGLSPEYWTERIMERLISISDNADPHDRDWETFGAPALSFT